jgi:hypothetical protein
MAPPIQGPHAGTDGQIQPPPTRLAEKTHTIGVGVKEQGAAGGYSATFVLGGLGLMSPISTLEIVYSPLPPTPQLLV